MVHADASTFADGVKKEEAYKQVLEQTESLIEGQRNWVSNLANAASLLWHAYKSLPSPLSEVNWAGFYVLDPSTTEQLILGPFQGGVACQTIAFSRGVCGLAARSGAVQLVDNVDDFPGHIACDSASKSEIVVPIVLEGKTVGVIDVDCALVSGFDAVDAEGLQALANLLAKGCDW